MSVICGSGSFMMVGMGVLGALALVALVLGIGALAKYLRRSALA